MNQIPLSSAPPKHQNASVKTRCIAAFTGALLFLFASIPLANAATILTSYEAATASVRDTGSAGNWSFYWNRWGEMGYLASYEALIKDGSAGSYQLIPGNGQFGGIPAGYLKINYGGGTLGYGYMNTGSNGIARGTVAAYTFQESGFFQIQDIILSRSTTKADEVLTVRIWLESDQSLMGSLVLPHSAAQNDVVSLDVVDLGYLEAGSRVFVTVDSGPYVGARYYLDYKIAQVPEATTGSLLISATAAGLVLMRIRKAYA